MWVYIVIFAVLLLALENYLFHRRIFF